MRRIETEIIINSSKSNIWRVLTDLSLYSDWCSSISFQNGTVRKGEIVTMTTKTPDGSGTTYTGKGKILEVISEKTLIWKGGMSGFLVGHHFWHLEKVDSNKTRLIQGEDFYGIYPFLVGNKKIQSFQPFYEQINLELKDYVERELA